jgi:hypothetical protein
MEKDWEKIFTSGNIQEAYMLKAILEENEIEVVDLNQQDSSYPVFGEIKLYVHRDNIIRSMQIINKMKDE